MSCSDLCCAPPACSPIQLHMHMQAVRCCQVTTGSVSPETPARPKRFVFSDAETETAAQPLSTDACHSQRTSCGCRRWRMLRGCRWTHPCTRGRCCSRWPSPATAAGEAKLPPAAPGFPSHRWQTVAAEETHQIYIAVLLALRASRQTSDPLPERLAARGAALQAAHLHAARLVRPWNHSRRKMLLPIEP